MRGELVGINTAIFSNGLPASAGVGFSIPINRAREVMDRILKYGKVVRAYMGIYPQDLTEGIGEQFGIKDRHGAIISDVVPDSPADRAGLRTGDVIVAFNGQTVNDAVHLRNMASLTPPGTKAPIKYLRDGKEQTATVELGELKEQQSARTGEGAESNDNTLSGIEVDALTPSLLRHYNIPRNLTGVVISDVADGSPAADAGLRPSDVILEVNREPITSVEDFRKAVSRVGNRRAILRVYFAQRGGIQYVELGPRN
jgi:serine protease Do